MESYQEQVQLLLSVIPEVAKEEIFALHGGTAINLFDRNLPRLSVDVDLTYLPVKKRKESLKEIHTSLQDIKKNILKINPSLKVSFKKKQAKLWVGTSTTSVKVEVNLIKRGCYEKPVIKELCSKAQEEYKSYSFIQCVEEGHLYGGKLCAAMDRQHPRDLFDVMLLLRDKGITEDIKKGFIFYLISGSRPIKEILFPHLQSNQTTFNNQFSGMTKLSFTYRDYEETRSKMINQLQQSFTSGDIEFINSIVKGKPRWEIYDFSEFPAVKWKLLNLNKLKLNDIEKYKNLCSETEKALASISQ